MGAFFFQDDVRDALDQVCKGNKENDAMLGKCAKTRGLSRSTLLERVAYFIRVMCSHVRLKYNGQRRRGIPNDPDFGETFTTLSKNTPEKRRCAISGFSSDNDESGEEDPDVLVATYWDGALRGAYQLWKSGKLEPALWYEEGSDGFVKAYFEDGEFDTGEGGSKETYGHEDEEEEKVCQLAAHPHYRQPARGDAERSRYRGQRRGRWSLRRRWCRP